MVPAGRALLLAAEDRRCRLSVAALTAVGILEAFESSHPPAIGWIDWGRRDG